MQPVQENNRGAWVHSYLPGACLVPGGIGVGAAMGFWQTDAQFVDAAWKLTPMLIIAACVPAAFVGGMAGAAHFGSSRGLIKPSVVSFFAWGIWFLAIVLALWLGFAAVVWVALAVTGGWEGGAVDAAIGSGLGAGYSLLVHLGSKLAARRSHR